MDTLVSIKIFRLVAELGSFSSAARRMSISTAMASKHVIDLESKLGTRLLNRTSRRLSLTEPGAIYLDHSRRMLDELNEVEAVVRNATTSPTGVLKVSVPVWMANAEFVQLLSGYQSAFPEVRLDIDMSGRQVNLVEEGSDLALRVTSRGLLPSTLVARPIGKVTFRLVGSRAYLRRAGYPSMLAELARTSCPACVIHR